MLSDYIISLDDIRMLQEDLLRASLCEKNDANFVNYMFTAIQQYIEFDVGCCGMAKIENDLQLNILKAFNYKISDKMLIEYEKWSNKDTHFKQLISKKGKVIYHNDLYESYDQHLNSKIFIEFDKKYDMYHTISVLFQLPNTDKIIFLVIIRSNITNHFGIVEKNFVQMNSAYLFYLLIERLKIHNFQLPSNNFTPNELAIIKLLANEQHDFSNKQIAKKLDKQGKVKSYRTIEHQLDSIYQKLKLTGIGTNKKIQLVKIASSLCI